MDLQMHSKVSHHKSTYSVLCKVEKYDNRKEIIMVLCHFRGQFSKQILKGQTSHILYASMMEEFQTCNGKKEIKNLIV